LTISELAERLRGVSDALDRTAAYTAAAVPSLEEAKAVLLGVKRVEDGWYPAELELAIAEVNRASELIARGRQAVIDYLMRL
jgi:hypothetical protein